MPKFAVRNCLHIMLASNSDWVAPVGMDDRRYFFLDVSEEKKGDQEHFGRLINQIDNGGKEAFIYHLLHHDISEFNPRLLPKSQSTTRLDNKLRTRGTVAQWWNDVLDDGFIQTDSMTLISRKDWRRDVFVATHLLHDHYLAWCRKHNERYFEKKQGFSRALNEMMPWEIHDRKNGQRVIKFLALKTCRRQWQKLLRK